MIEPTDEIIAYLTKLKEILRDPKEYREIITSYDKLYQLWLISSQIVKVNDFCNRILELSEKTKVDNSLREKLSTQLSELTYSLNKFDEVLKEYGTPDNILVELGKSEANNLINITNELEEVLNDISDTLTRMRRYVARQSRAKAFQGRKGRDVKSNLLELWRILNASLNTINRLIDYLGEVLMSVHVPQVKEGLRDYAYLITQLEAAVSKGLWSQHLVEILTGLKSITGDPSSGNIHFILEEEENPEIEPSLISIDELFYRYPPFEPIAEKRRFYLSMGKRKISIPIAGCYLWFIKCRNFAPETEQLFEQIWKNKRIIEGESIISGMHEEIQEVKPINILRLRDGELKIKISGEKFYIRIKYGSRRLIETLSKLSNRKIVDDQTLIKKLQELYEKEIGRTGKAYRVNDLTYVWYCKLGFAMSTDPWDFKDCPFRAECYRGRKIKSERCVYWSYSRRIFPKVFGVTERRIFGLNNLNSTSKIGIFTPVYGVGVSVQEMYRGVQWSMPADFGSSIVAFAEFENPVIKPLPRTNVIGFCIPYSLVKALILELIDPEVTPKPIILVSDKLNQTLDKLLLSKYFIWEGTQRGTRTFSFFGRAGVKLLEEYKKFTIKVYKNKELSEKVAEFGIIVLAHTLAHLLSSYLSKELEIEYKDLIYLTHIDKDRDSIYILVAENSPLGVIDIVGHVKKKFGRIDKMLEKFIDEAINMLKEHESELKLYLNEINRAFSRYSQTKAGGELKEVINRLNEYYKNFVENGLILDLHSFMLHLHLNEVYFKLSRDLDIEYSQILTELGNILQFVGPTYCVDGCTSCIVLESGCTMPLSQNLELSRNLTLWFLRSLFKGESITAKGRRLGETLLKVLPEKSLFIVTPYLDEDGAKLLKEVASKGVDLTIITRKQTYLEYKDAFNNAQVFFFTTPRHEKIYIIDDRILVDTTWNLTLSSPSTNRFEIKVLDSQDITHIKNQILLNSRKI